MKTLHKSIKTYALILASVPALVFFAGCEPAREEPMGPDQGGNIQDASPDRNESGPGANPAY